MENMYQIRVSEELLNAMLDLSSMVDGLDVSGIIRKTIRWMNKGNAVPSNLELLLKERGVYDKYLSMANSRHNNRLIKVRTEDAPPVHCKHDEFRSVLAYRVLMAMSNMKKRPSAFKTEFINGRDFVVVEQE